MRREVLEREAELSLLAGSVRAAAGGAGSVVLLMGEAGIGKSSLVEALRAHLPAEGRMIAGYCDDLVTPRTLGPFRDLVGSVGAELSRAVLDGSDRDRVLAALRAELSWPEHPTVLVSRGRRPSTQPNAAWTRSSRRGAPLLRCWAGSWSGAGSRRRPACSARPGNWRY